MEFEGQILSSEKQKGSQCQLCQGENFGVMLNRALYDRYLANINLYYTDCVDDFIQEEITPETCKFKEQLCDSNDEELLKRQYSFHQFPNKIQMLSEYYKFHRDVPKIFQKNVFNIMGKYFDRLRHFDYKKIKNVLKQEQGISLTTQRSDESSVYSDEVKKSRYSTVLHDLNKNSQTESQILHDLCQKIDKAYEKISFKKDFKGQFFSGQKKFKQYLLNLKKSNRQSEDGRLLGERDNHKIKNYNLFHNPMNEFQLCNLNIKTERLESKKKNFKKKNQQAIYRTGNTLKESLKNLKKTKSRNCKSIQKTTANQTISREEKSKRLQKLQKTLEFQIQKNQNQMFKPFSAALIGLKENAMLKTLNQIYKPIAVNQKYHSDKSKKSSQHHQQNLNKLCQNKLSSRKSVQKGKSKYTSVHNSKEFNSNFKDAVTTTTHDNKNARCQPLQDLLNCHQKNPQLQSSAIKRLSRSKSVAKHSQSNLKRASEKQLNLTERKQRMLSKSAHKQKRLGSTNCLHNCFQKNKKQIQVRHQKENRERSLSRKSLNSAVKGRSSSKSILIKQKVIDQQRIHSKQNTQKLSNTQKLKQTASKSNVSSARVGHINQGKFNTIDPESITKSIDQFIQKKLSIAQKTKSKAKFFK